MLRRCVALVVALATSSAFANDYWGGPGPCGGWFTRNWVQQPTIDADPTYFIPSVDGGGGSHSASSSGGSGGGGDVGDIGDGRVLLVLAVVALAVLPVLVYVVDAPATPDVMQCWAVPTEHFSFYGGALGGGTLSTGYFGARTELSIAFLGINAAGETRGFGGDSYYDVYGAVSLRIPPKQHLDIELSIGGRQIVDRTGVGSWLEVSLPHRYLVFRQDAMNPGVSLAIRPALLFSFGHGIDARIEAALEFPFGPWADVELGGRIYSFQSDIRFGGMFGLSFHL
jgi:hypothetical protein